MFEVTMYRELTLLLAGKTTMHCTLVHNAPLQWIHPNSSTWNPWRQHTHTHTQSCICCQTIHLCKLTVPVTQVSKVA